MDFLEKNKNDWKTILKDIFDTNIPQRHEWTDLFEIVDILNKIGRFKSSNHMFYPSGGGMDICSAKISTSENMCIEIDTDGIIDILKPRVLIFHSFDSDEEWYYFRLETQNLDASGVYEYIDTKDKDTFEEEVVELESGRYISRSYWDEGSYNGEDLPKTARVVVRHFKGAFVIFRKTSTYNKMPKTYDGIHNKVNDENFRKSIESVINKIKQSNNE